MRWAGDVLCILVVIGVCLFFGLPRYRSNLDLSDEGLLAYGGVRVLKGEAPNRDFVSLQGPLSFYITAATFRILGTALTSLRILGVALYLVIALLIYGLSRHFVGSAVSMAAAIPATVLGINFFGFVPYAVWQAIAASLAAGLLYLRAVANCGKGAGRILAVLAGLATGCSILLRQDQALYLILAILVYAGVLRVAAKAGKNELAAVDAAPPAAKEPGPGASRVLVFWLAGIMAVLLPFFVYCATQGIVPELFRQLVVFPLTTYAKTSALPFPKLSTSATVAEKAVAIAYYVPPAFGVLFASFLARRAVRRRFGEREATLTFMLAWSALFYGLVMTRSDYRHFLTSLPPFYVLCAWGWGELIERLFGGKAQANRVIPWRGYKWVVSGSVAAAVAGFLWVVKPIFLPPALPATEEVRLERAGVRKAGARNLEKFVGLIQSYAPPERAILCLPYEPMFYFLSERRNPTRWNYLWPGDQTTRDHLRLIAEASADPPAVVVTTNEEELRRFAPEIVRYIHENFVRAQTAGGMFVVYVPAH